MFLFRLFDNEQGQETLTIYEQMLTQIDNLRKEIHNSWITEVKKHIKEYMQYSLLDRDQKKQLFVNFHQNLKYGLKDIKYMTMQELSITDDIQAFYDSEDKLWVKKFIYVLLI